MFDWAEIEATITKSQALDIWYDDEFKTIVGNHKYVDIVLASTLQGDLSVCPVCVYTDTSTTTNINDNGRFEVIVLPVFLRQVDRKEDWGIED